MSWKLALAGVALLAVVSLLWVHGRRRNPLDLADVLRDRSTGKASLSPLVILLSFGLSCVAVIAMLARGQDVTTLLLGILGIFVVKMAVTQTVDTFKGPPPTPDTTGSTITKTSETETRTIS